MTAPQALDTQRDVINNPNAVPGVNVIDPRFRRADYDAYIVWPTTVYGESAGPNKFTQKSPMVNQMYEEFFMCAPTLRDMEKYGRNSTVVTICLTAGQDPTMCSSDMLGVLYSLCKYEYMRRLKFLGSGMLMCLYLLLSPHNGQFDEIISYIAELPGYKYISTAIALPGLWRILQLVTRGGDTLAGPSRGNVCNAGIYVNPPPFLLRTIDVMNETLALEKDDNPPQVLHLLCNLGWQEMEKNVNYSCRPTINIQLPVLRRRLMKDLYPVHNDFMSDLMTIPNNSRDLIKFVKTAYKMSMLHNTG